MCRPSPQILLVLLYILYFPTVRTNAEEDVYTNDYERLPPAWYAAYLSNDGTQYLLSHNDRETALSAFFNQTNLTQDQRQTGSGRQAMQGSYTYYLAGSVRPGSSRGHTPSNDSPYLTVLREPYGPDDMYKAECMQKRCDTEHVCVAPLGIPRCMPTECFANPLRGSYIRPSGNFNLLNTIKPLEWQFTNRETEQLEKRATETTSHDSVTSTTTGST